MDIVRPRRAFTLIELLVVIAILSLLIAILLPGIKRARIQAKRAACASNLHQIGVGFQDYLSNSNGIMPYASLMPSVGPAPLFNLDHPIYIADVLLDYSGGEPKVFKCPSDYEDSGRLAPNSGRSYFESEKSSYEYRTDRPGIGGRKLEELAQRMSQFTGRAISDNMIWIMRDYGDFHAATDKPDELGKRRYLYIDGHVGDYEN